MIDNQTFFDHTIQELEARIKSNSEYDLLMTTPLLRKLLVDGDNSLICQIDKKGKKLRFNINQRSPLHKRFPDIFSQVDLKTYCWFAEDGIDPDSANILNDFRHRALSLDDFLKHVVIYAMGQEITIRDLIKHLSDKEGGVHKQRREINEREQKNLVLRELGRKIGINNLKAGLSTLRAICRIVIRDLSVFKSEVGSIEVHPGMQGIQ